MTSILLQATFFRESPMTDMPNKNRAIPPIRDRIPAISIKLLSSQNI
jgi:hypothetical protein